MPTDRVHPNTFLTKREAPRRVTRLAPSPTGALHLGNALSFVLTFALAQKFGWRVVLRIEDLDTPRNKPGAAEETVSVLSWLGVSWETSPSGLLYQAADLSPYTAAMETLARRALAFPSNLTRGELAEAAASAPQAGSHEAVCPAALRPRLGPRAFDQPETAWRFATPEGGVAFEDALAGPQQTDPAQSIGDFLIWTKRGHPAYQLAVVIDDARQGVTDIVRGNDLLDSTGRQMLLRQALRLSPDPRHWHHPLVRGPDGRRLAKRHGDTRLSSYRQAGTAPERVIGLVGAWLGVSARPEPMTTTQLAQRLEVSTIPKHDLTFTEDHDRWLREL